eukprot:1630921-Pyramimonas_sp.AAC.1
MWGFPDKEQRPFSTTAPGPQGNLKVMSGPRGHAGELPPASLERAHVEVADGSVLGPEQGLQRRRRPDPRGPRALE